jgi:hypothetical protein
MLRIKYGLRSNAKADLAISIHTTPVQLPFTHHEGVIPCTDPLPISAGLAESPLYEV